MCWRSCVKWQAGLQTVGFARLIRLYIPICLAVFTWKPVEYDNRKVAPQCDKMFGIVLCAAVTVVAQKAR